MAPTLPTPIQIHNQTDTSIYLINASHVFLDPVEIAPASAGPVGYIPSRSSRDTLNLAFSHVDGRRNWLLNLSSKGRWTKGGWEAVYAREVVAPETAVKADEGEARSQTSTIRHKPHALRFYRIKVRNVPVSLSCVKKLTELSCRIRNPASRRSLSSPHPQSSRGSRTYPTTWLSATSPYPGHINPLPSTVVSLHY